MAVSLCECLKALLLQGWCRAVRGSCVLGGGVSLPPGQNTFLCRISPFQAREATSAWGQHAFNGAFMQGVLKCAVAVGLITQGVWFGIST